jgi:hypothetical protein
LADVANCDRWACIKAATCSAPVGGGAAVRGRAAIANRGAESRVGISIRIGNAPYRGG